jgi:O-antigen/teichoic acid export membrane protein
VAVAERPDAAPAGTATVSTDLVRPELPAPALTSSSWIRSAGLLSLATILISLGNYAYSLTVVRLLRPVEFSRFSAGQSVLLVLSNGGMAAIPWAVARYIVLEDGPRARSEALSFGLRASALLSLVAAAAAELILVGVAGLQVATVTAVGSALMFMVAGPVGYLQGTDRVDRLAWFRIVEVVVRVGTGLFVILLLSKTASWALVGFPVGAAVMLGISVAGCRDGFPLSRPHASASRSLMRQSVRLGAVQLALVSLGAIDAVAVLASHLPARQTASYLAASLIGRVPLFVSTAVSIAAFAALTAARDDGDVADHMGQLLRFYGVLTVPVVIGCFTVPHRLLSLLIPSSYELAPTLLKYTCLSGAAIGLINCITTAHQARGRIKSALAILLPAAFLQPVLLIALGRSGGIQVFCVGLVALSVVTAGVVTWDARRWLNIRPPAPVTVLLVVVIGGLGVVASRVHGPVVWSAVMVVVTGTVAVMLLRKRTSGAPAPS